MFHVADKIDAKTATLIVKEISTVETTPSHSILANRNCVLMTRHYPSSGASSIQSKLVWKEWPSTENAFGEIPYMQITTQGNVSPRSAWKIHRSQFNCSIRILGYISSWQQNLAGNSHSTCFIGIKDARVAGGEHGNLCQGPRRPLRPGNVWQGQIPGKQVLDTEKMKPTWQ